MDVFLDELRLSMPDGRELARIVLRLVAALVVGACIGLQRELTGKSAGFRTHMLVALGTTLFVVAAAEAGMTVDSDAMSRVIQGIATGIGFLGAGAILKLKDEREIHGLTTAAGVWMTAAASTAIGIGRIGVGLMGLVFSLLVLSVLARLERHIEQRSGRSSRSLAKGERQ